MANAISLGFAMTRNQLGAVPHLTTFRRSMVYRGGIYKMLFKGRWNTVAKPLEITLLVAKNQWFLDVAVGQFGERGASALVVTHKLPTPLGLSQW